MTAPAQQAARCLGELETELIEAVAAGGDLAGERVDRIAAGLDRLAGILAELPPGAAQPVRRRLGDIQAALDRLRLALEGQHADARTLLARLRKGRTGLRAYSENA